MSKPTVYLAGPMTGLSWRDATHWRERAAMLLAPAWRIITPVKGQVDFSNMNELIQDGNQIDQTAVKPLEFTATGITMQDEFYIRQSDVILANFMNVEKVSIGTVWELGFAWGLNKQIISVIQPGSVHDHSFVRRRSHVFVQELDEALDFLQKMAV